MAWLLGLLGVTVSGSGRSAPPAHPPLPAPRGNSAGAAIDVGRATPSTGVGATATAAKAKLNPGPEAPADPFAPFTVASAEAIPVPADLYANGRIVRASNSGPVNSEAPDPAYFVDPRMGQGDNSGRLFYSQFFLENPHDPLIQERREWFICWTPLNGGTLAQRLFNAEGFLIEELTLEGAELQVHHMAFVGEAKQVDVYRWQGDALGHGQFVLKGTPPASARIAPPTPFEVERDRGYKRLSERRYDVALAAFEGALKLKPGDAATFFALGVTYMEMGANRTSPPIDQAITAFSQAIAADPKRTPAYQRRAALFLLKKKYDLAIADCTERITLETDVWESYMDRARAYAERGDSASAIADTQKAARLAPTETSPWVTMALYQYRAEAFEAAIASGRKALELSDSNTEIRITMACAYARLGKVEPALKVYSEAKANGVGATERRFGIRELQRFLKNGKPNAAIRSAVQKVMEQLIGPDQQEPLGEDESL